MRYTNVMDTSLVKTVWASLTFACVLPAQVTVEAVTANKIIVEAKGKDTSTQTIAKDTDVSKGFTLVAAASSGPCTSYAFSRLRMMSVFGGTLAEFQNVVSTTVPDACTVTSSAGPNQVLVTFRSPKPVAGRLVLTITQTKNKTGRADASIDVGNDGGVDHTTDGNIEVDAVVGPAGVSILLECSASSPGPKDVTFANSVAGALFVPNGGRFDVVGRPCGKTTLEGYRTKSLLHLVADDVPVGNTSILVIGVKAVQLPIPPVNCLLYTDPLISVGVSVRNGSSTLSVPLPPVLPRGEFRFQHLIVSSGAWRTSNAVSLRL